MLVMSTAHFKSQQFLQLVAASLCVPDFPVEREISELISGGSDFLFGSDCFKKILVDEGLELKFCNKNITRLKKYYTAFLLP